MDYDLDLQCQGRRLSDSLVQTPLRIYDYINIYGTPGGDNS